MVKEGCNAAFNTEICLYDFGQCDVFNDMYHFCDKESITKELGPISKVSVPGFSTYDSPSGCDFVDEDCTHIAMYPLCTTTDRVIKDPSYTCVSMVKNNTSACERSDHMHM
mmetsp:Transcript_28694/g.32981  ORF Transcript_28694/g.32981 Transcript_28694/m.32981 type:complete len:111 (+) Transcript_28694:1268-1600(+)